MQRGAARALVQALLTSAATTNPPAADRCPAKRSQHRASAGQDARSERPATGHGQPRACGQEGRSKRGGI